MCGAVAARQAVGVCGTRCGEKLVTLPLRKWRTSWAVHVLGECRSLLGDVVLQTLGGGGVSTVDVHEGVVA